MSTTAAGSATNNQAARRNTLLSSFLAQFLLGSVPAWLSYLLARSRVARAQGQYFARWPRCQEHLSARPLGACAPKLSFCATEVAGSLRRKPSGAKPLSRSAVRASPYRF